MTIDMQLFWLFTLAIPIACVAWTVTHEEVFREPRSWCVGRCRDGKTLLERKFFYLFTCEYCFSHYITVVFLYFTKYHLLLNDWRGYIISGFTLVFVANVYMSLFALVRQSTKKEKTEIKVLEEQTEKSAQEKQ